jgi:hypothetical protein
MLDFPLPFGPSTTEKSWKNPISFRPLKDLKFSRINLCSFNEGKSFWVSASDLEEISDDMSFGGDIDLELELDFIGDFFADLFLFAFGILFSLIKLIYFFAN